MCRYHSLPGEIEQDGLYMWSLIGEKERNMEVRQAFNIILDRVRLHSQELGWESLEAVHLGRVGQKQQGRALAAIQSPELCSL